MTDYSDPYSVYRDYSAAEAGYSTNGHAVRDEEPAQTGGWDEAVQAAERAGVRGVMRQRVVEEYRRLEARRIAKELFDRDHADHSADADLDAEFLDLNDLDELPEPEPLIHPAGNGDAYTILPRHCYGILRGRDQSFKSFLCLDWALCLATGKPWQGRRTERVKVLYIAGEGAYGLKKRRDAWCKEHGVTPEPGWFVVRKSALNLHNPGDAFDHLLAHIRAGGYGLVIIDTVRRVSGGADGNSSEMGVVVDNIKRILDATADGTVLAVAHTDKGDNDTRGFSGIEDDADFVWAVKRDDRKVTAGLEKMKDGPDGMRITLAARPVAESLVLTEATEVDEPAATESAIRVLDAMRSMFRNGVRTAELRGVLVPSVMSKATFYRTLTDLEVESHLVNVGTEKVPFWVLPDPRVDCATG